MIRTIVGWMNLLPFANFQPKPNIGRLRCLSYRKMSNAMARRKLPPPNVVHNDSAGAEKRLRELKHGFNRVSRRWDPSARPKEFINAVWFPALTAICSFAFVWYLVTSPWPVFLTVKHLISFPNCNAAEAVGLAPARRGQPGYWSHNDADNDGIACEPPKWRLRHVTVPVPL